MEILDEVKKDYVCDLVRKKKRVGERAFDEYRKISIERNVVSSAEGSARVKIGDTMVLAAVKLGIATPFADRPTEGVLQTNSELLPLASSTFESGPPGEQSIELARVVDRGIRSAEIVDLKSFYIEPAKVWSLFIDLYVLDYDGNLIDASALAAMAALTEATMPKYEDGKVIRENTGKLPLKEGKVVACTFSKIGNSILVDPCRDEEIATDSFMTLSTTEKFVCASQKAGGGAGYTQKEVEDCIDMAFKKGNELRALI
ncbi:MAG: exosome complex protein Rrp42 [Candidatus Micrarchaeota archaeon]